MEGPLREDLQDDKNDGGGGGGPGGGCEGDAMRGNPCNAATGNKYQVEVDITGGAGIPGLTRHYNSRFDQDMGLGVGWSANLGKRLEIYGTLIQIRQGSGRGEPFTCPEGEGVCTGDPDTDLALTKNAGGYTLSYPDGRREDYDADGRLVSDTTPAGLTTSYAYSNNQLTAVTGPFGHTLSLVWSADQLASITDSAGAVYAYSYDGNDNLTQVSYPDGSGKRYHYENASFPNHLTGISHVEADGTATRYATYAYDADGKAISTEHAGGIEAYDLAYDSDTQSTVTDAAGTQEIMTFAEHLGVKNLIANINQADGKARVQTFDANNNLNCKKDEEGRVTTYTYNSANQKLSMTEGQTGDCANPIAGPETRTTAWQYVSADLDVPTRIETPSVQAGETKRVRLTYGDSRFPALPTEITQSGFTPDGAAVVRTVTMSYNHAGQVTAIDGFRTGVSDVTTLGYYDCATGGACGRLQSVTNALGQTTTYDAYDAAGRLTQMTDPNGLVTSYAYDARGRVTAMTQTPPSGVARTTRYTYDAAGNVTSVTFPDGIELSYRYDAALKLREITDNVGNRIEYGYDLKGNRTEEATRDPDGTLVRLIETAYDHRNHVKTINNGGAVTEQLNDALGNLTRTTDPNQIAAGSGLHTAHAYDALNRLVETIDTLSGTTRYGYDVDDRLTRVKAPNDATTEYVYDDLGNLLREISPDRGTTIYTYDAAGNVKTITDARGVTAAYTYDALNRLTGIDYPGEDEDVAFTYDTPRPGAATACDFGTGRLCAVQDQSGTTDYAYDPYGNRTEQVKTELGATYTTRYAYDAGDRITAIDYPDGRAVTYTRDILGRIETVSATVNDAETTITTERTYRADGRLLSQAYGNGLAEVREYNLKGELTYQSLGTADTRLYGYDPNGNLIEKQSLPEVATYGYDALDRLNGAEREGPTEFYNYDPNGNRLSDRTRTYAYEPESNRLAVAGGSAITLDPAGNTLSDGAGREYRYNRAGRLEAVHVDGLEVASYTYNHLGQRTRKVTAQETRLYHYNPSGRLLAETVETKSARAYVWADRAPLAQIDTVLKSGKAPPPRARGKLPARATTERLSFLHPDHLATPRLATDTEGAKVWSWEGEAFGATLPDEDPDGDGLATTVNLRLPGQYFDQETALFYNWNRYYDPKLGRYIGSDPIGLDGGTNTYAYVESNPLRYVDPEGLVAIPAPGIPLPPAIPGNPSTSGAGDGGSNAGSRERDNRRGRERPDRRSIPKPEKPSCGCTCICRADANDNIPGNIKPGDKTFAFGQATAANCAEASKEAKRRAIHALGKQPKHVGCRCSGR